MITLFITALIIFLLARRFVKKNFTFKETNLNDIKKAD